MECTLCGACCVAPDIAALDKPLGLRCPHLTENNLCSMYENRPSICRDYQADEVCRLIEAPTLEERVDKYLALFDLTAEAKAVKEQGCASMKRARLQRSPAEAASTPTQAPVGERPR
ncbi:YkgJ family cysteine cluster protein [Corallococcus terminator]